jgi:hypothetical protein
MIQSGVASDMIAKASEQKKSSVDIRVNLSIAAEKKFLNYYKRHHMCVSLIFVLFSLQLEPAKQQQLATAAAVQHQNRCCTSQRAFSFSFFFLLQQSSIIPIKCACASRMLPPSSAQARPPK